MSMVSSAFLKGTAYELKEYYKNADELVQLIIRCAGVAAAADAAGSLIPAISVPATIIGCVGSVWAMYGLMCKKLEIPLNNNVLKLLARAAVSNIAANLGGALVSMVVAMCVPGASVAASAVVSFITVYLAGYVFMKLVLGLAKSGKAAEDIAGMNSDELKQAMKGEKVTKADMDAAKDAFKESH